MAEQPVDKRAFASGYDPNMVADYIVKAAEARGIDPNVALRVAKSEGLYGYVGDQGSSFGPFQLHYGNVAPGGNKVSGLGDEFTRVTGLNARDPRTWQAQVDFSLGEAARSGWGAWHGWKGASRAGLPGGPPAGQLYETRRFVPQEQLMQYAGPLQPLPPQSLPPQMFAPESIAYAQPQAQPAPLYRAPANQVASASIMNDASPVRAPQLTHDNFLDDHFLSEQPATAKAPAQQGQPAPLSHDNFLDAIEETPQPTPRQNQQPGEVAAVGPKEWGVGRSFARGASWGLAEPLEVAASIAKHGTHGMSYGEAFSKGMENIAKEREAYRIAAPGTSAIAEGLGAAVGVPGLAAARTIGAIGKAAVAGARAVPELAAAVPTVSKFVSGAGGMASKATRGAIEGAGLAAAEQAPWMTRPEDRSLGNVLTGAVGGGAGSALLAPITKALTLPFKANISPGAAQTALNVNNKFGLNIRPSQLSTNPVLKEADEKLVSAGVKNKQFEDWHKAVAQDLNTTANNFGKPNLGVSDLSKPSIESAKRATGQELDNLVAGTTLTPNAQLGQRLRAISQHINNTTDAANPVRQAYADAIQRLRANVGPGGIKGEAFRDLIKYHGYVSNTFLTKNDPVFKKVGRDLRNALIDSFEISNPALRGEYNQLTNHYQKLLAIGSLAKDDMTGFINPKSLLDKVSKRNLSGDLLDLAKVGKRIVKEPMTRQSTLYRDVRNFAIPQVLEHALLGMGVPAGGLGAVSNALQAANYGMRVPERMAMQSPYLAKQVFTGNQMLPNVARAAERFGARVGANVLTGYGAPEKAR